MRIISGYPCVRCGGTLAADPETYGVRIVCLQCGHDCHVAPLPGRGGHRAGQELADDDSPRSAWVVHCPAADDCTECPMSRCRFDDARWWRAGRKAAFEALFTRLLTAGYAAESIAEQTGFSKRTVYRANRRHHIQMDYSDEDLAAFARIHDVPSVEALGPRLRLRPAPVKPKGRQCVDCETSIEGRRGPAVRCEPCGVVYARQWRRDYVHRKKQESAPVGYPVWYSSSGVPLGSLPHRHEPGEDYCTVPACRPALEVAALE